MKFLSLLLLITTIFIEAKRVETKVMHAHEPKGYNQHYSHSSNSQDREDDILCSTTQASGEIIFMIAVQATTEVTSNGNSSGGYAKMSYIDNNRVEITQDIAKGEGEYLETLLSIIKPNYNRESLAKIQQNFDKLIYLNHKEFLEKIEDLV